MNALISDHRTEVVENGYKSNFLNKQKLKTGCEIFTPGLLAMKNL